ncbi:MAG: malonic semialdehyde reductase [Burkholderiales bacterium]
MSFHTNSPAIEQLFETARSHNGWRDTPVPPESLRELHRLASIGPTAFNAQPMRLVFVTTAEGRARLLPALRPTNVDKTMSAPVAAIVAYDTRFYELIPRLYHNPAAGEMFINNPQLAGSAAFRNGTLQGAYLIMAARALGLDCGPMSGFDNAKVDAEFFPDGRFKSNFLCAIGKGDPAKLFARLPRLGFDDACVVC